MLNSSLNCNGSSHSLATNYYQMILMHSLDTMYPDKSPTMAYRAGNYSEFKSDRSLAKSCPLATVGDKNREATDLHRCSIPIDYLLSPSEYRRDLTKKFNLDLNVTNRFHLMTSSSEPYRCAY